MTRALTLAIAAALFVTAGAADARGRHGGGRGHRGADNLGMMSVPGPDAGLGGGKGGKGADGLGAGGATGFVAPQAFSGGATTGARRSRGAASLYGGMTTTIGPAPRSGGRRRNPYAF